MTKPISKTTEEIKEFLQKRTEVGYEKYGVSMDRTDLTPEEWLTHHIEELGDAIQYAWRLRDEIRAMRERITELEKK